MEKFTYRAKVDKEDAEPGFKNVPITTYAIAIDSIFEPHRNNTFGVNVIKFKCESDSGVTIYVDVPLNEFGKSFDKYFAPLAIKKFFIERPEKFSKNKLNEMFERFLESLISEFYINGGKNNVRIDKTYINKIGKKYLLADKDKVWELTPEIKVSENVSIDDKSVQKHFHLIEEATDWDKEIDPSILMEMQLVMMDNKFNIILFYLFALPLKEILWNKLKVKFPHLLILGEQGSGKSTAISELVQPFLGYKQGSLIATGTTPFANLKNLSSTTGIVIYDEYKSGEYNNQKLKKLNEYIRLSYDRNSDQRGTQQQEILNYQLLANLIIGGESFFEDNAIIERSVIIHSYKSQMEDNYFTKLKNGTPTEFMKHLRFMHLKVIKSIYSMIDEDWKKMWKSSDKIVEEFEKNYFRLPNRKRESLKIMWLSKRAIKKALGVEINFDNVVNSFRENGLTGETLNEQALLRIIELRDNADFSNSVSVTNEYIHIHPETARMALLRADREFRINATQFTKELSTKEYFKSKGEQVVINGFRKRCLRIDKVIFDKCFDILRDFKVDKYNHNNNKYNKPNKKQIEVTTDDIK